MMSDSQNDAYADVRLLLLPTGALSPSFLRRCIISHGR